MRKIFRYFLLFAVAWCSSVQAKDNAIESLRETGKAFASVAKKVSPSVVFIRVEGSASGSFDQRQVLPFGDEWPFGDDLFKRFFGEPWSRPPKQEEPEQQQVIGQGTGFIFSSEKGVLSDKAYVLTNNHVVENADKIIVKLMDKREFTAEIVGTDKKSDVAVLKIKASGLPTLTLGDSSGLEVGEWVIAIGNPFGLSHTLTVGVVSAKGRSSVGINDYEDFIQTDAAINPGNSGGPLLNLDGEVVGMNTAIFSRSGGYMGIGFAIPADLVKSVANQLTKNGAVTRGYLGVVIQELTPELAHSFDIKETQGILIAQVSDDSPAKKAGLKAGDVIINFNDEPVSSIGHFRNRVALTSPGTREKLTILRDGQQKTVTVEIGKLEAEKQLAQSQESSDKLGITVQTLTPELAKQYDISDAKGVLVTGVERGSVAAMAGIEPGTLILQVDRKQVNSAEEFIRAVRKSSKVKNILLLIQHREMSRYVVLRWK